MRGPRHRSLRCACGATVFAAALAISCVRPPRTTDLVFPDETLVVSAQSTRPMEMEAASATSARPAFQADTGSRAPIPSLSGVLMPVFAEANAPAPSSVLEPRLARLHAQEEARLEALTLGLEEMAKWQEASLGATPSMSGEESVAALLASLGQTSTDQDSRAWVSWSPLSSPPRAGPELAAPTAVEPLPLTRRQQREMSREARDRAFASLERLLLANEVVPGLTLARWLEDQQVPRRRFNSVLNDSRVVSTEFSEDAGQNLHVCSVEIQFNYGLLNELH